MSSKSSKNVRQRKQERRAKNRRMKKEARIRGVIGITVATLILIALAVIAIMPELGVLRISVNILFRILLFALTLYVAWRFFDEHSAATRVIVSAVALLLFLPLILSSARVLLTVNLVVFWLLLLYMGYLLLFRETHCILLDLEAAFLLMYLFGEMNLYTFVENRGSIHFWQLLLPLSLLAAAAAFVLVRKGRIVFESKRAMGPWGSAVIVFVFALMVVWATIYHLNYILDVSTPTEYTVVIQDKDYNTGPKRPTTYSFEVELDGERIELCVSASDSRTYQIGDRYPVKRYKGAFRHAYYISANH